MKTLVKKILGAIQFFRFPKMRQSWGGPFNGQHFRKEIFSELITQFDFYTIFETGAFHGTTTDFMSTVFPSKIYTVEADSSAYGFCLARFWNNNQVSVSFGDSREFLRNHLKDPQFQNKPIFFYLDAHWEKDLPLLEECEIILANKIQSVIMIDDFEVIGDSGYRFDNYGLGKKLSLEYLKSIASSISIFYPNCKATQETGKKRGCVVLGTTSNIIDILRKTKTLIEYKWLPDINLETN